MLGGGGMEQNPYAIFLRSYFSTKCMPVNKFISSLKTNINNSERSIDTHLN